MAGLIGAAVCVPLLIAVYLLRLRRRPVRVSSVLFWERAAQDVQANVPLRWLRPSVLLFLQLLALASFLVALGRPAIDAGSRPAARLVILIDASASMAAPGAPDGETARTRLEEARARAAEIVERAMRAGAGPDGRATRVAVISFGAQPTLETGFTGERRQALRAIEGVEQTDQPGDLAPALRLAEAQASGPGDESSAGAGAGVRVALVSDGALDGAARASVGDAEFVFVRVGPDPGAPRDNLGIAQLSARRDYDDPALVRVFTRLVNAGERGVETAITLRAGADPLRAETVFVPPATAEGPGEAPVALEARVSGAATLTVSIARPDDLAADNAAALVIAPASRLRLLLVAPGGERGGPDPFLLRALEALDPQQFTRVSLEEYERRVTEPGWAAQYSMGVFDRASPSAPAPMPTLSFASAAGAPGVALERDDGSATVRIASWERSHPVMRYVSLDTLVMRSPATVSAATASGLRVRTLAQSEAGPVMALVEGGAYPRLVVSFVLAESNWPVQVGFAVFLANAAAALAPGATGAPGEAVTTAEPAIVRVARGATEVRATGPVERRAAATEGQATVSLGALPLAGVYRLEGAVESALAVNLVSEAESAIATRDEAPMVGSGEAGRGVAAAAPREIWRWFVLLGFGLATLEWLLQAWRLRR
jgi:hypothetical protein